jgi:Predicted oxidoreductases (related to aryl-alcohol dehydrogenases)
MRDQGLVDKIGISVYGPEELEALCARFSFDLVQSPFSVIDRRLVDSGWLARLRKQGVEIHVRSLFLQGLLLMEPGRRPDAFERWHSLWDRWHGWLNEESVTPLQACLSFALSEPRIDRVVVGVDSLRQLQAILTNADAIVTPPPTDLRSSDLDLINPSRWSVS